MFNHNHNREKTDKWIVNRSGKSLGMGVESRSAAGGSGGRSTVRVASGEAGDMAAWRNLKNALLPQFWAEALQCLALPSLQ